MPTWFARRVLDLVQRFTDIYYQHKYGAMARRLGRSTVSTDGRRGFLLLQIDGLSHKHLRHALDSGAMPYVEHLLASGRLNMAAWRCGLPSSTPAVQAGMMFGNRFDIPGFRWYEKDRRTTMTPQRLDQISSMYDRVREGQRGILKGGSCYVSMFDGDAELALFTLSTLRRQRFFESMRGFGLLVLFLLSPFRVLRVLGFAIADYASRLTRRIAELTNPVGKRLRSQLWHKGETQEGKRTVVNPVDVFSPMIQALSDALLTEVQTFGVMLDIYRCVPAIYANYNGYDEVAHELGPDHPAARRVLRGIDRRIHQIDRMRAHYRKREYDLYLMSDHGNTPAVPFGWQNGSTLGRHLVTGIEEGLSLDEQIEQHTHVRDRARYLREELRALESRALPRFRTLLSAARRYLEQDVERDGTVDYDVSRHRDVVVSASGSLAHVYFNVSQRPLDLIEVLLLYPLLVDKLTTTPGIGVVVGRADDRTIVLGNEGGTLEIGSAPDTVEPPNPLAPFGDTAYAARQIHRLAHFPHAGDLIVLGEVMEDGRVVSFESQAATHGGLGGSQAEPFIAWPPECDVNPDSINDAEDLYPTFIRYHDGADSAATPRQRDSR
jgi:hypothetical protein